MSKWLIMGEHVYDILPGEASKVNSESLNYYEYLNDGMHRAQVGKNVQASCWLVDKFVGQEGLVIEEPFGGLGVFAFALNKLLNPTKHRICELDGECVKQLEHGLGGDLSGVEITHGDAHDFMGVEPCNILTLDFPLYTYRRFMEKEWAAEFMRAAEHEPDMICVTDGGRFFYHLHWKNYNKIDGPGKGKFTKNFESYIEVMSEMFFMVIGYSITRCGHHSNCFYYSLEKKPVGEIEYHHFGEGTGPAGLRSADV